MIFDNSILQELKNFCDQTESIGELVKGKLRGFCIFHYKPNEITFFYYKKFNKCWDYVSCDTMEDYRSNFFLIKKTMFFIKKLDLKTKLKRINKDF